MPIPPSPIQGQITPRRSHRIYWRAAWEDVWSTGVDLADDTGELVDRLLCGPIEQRLKPAVDRMTLTWRTGELKYEDDSAFVARVMARLVGSFIKVVLLNDPVDPEADPEEEPLFVGYIAEQSVDVLGQMSIDSSIHRTDQTVAAYGLELLLDRNSIGESYCANTGVMFGDTDWVRRITHALVFNQMYERGLPNLSSDAELSRQGNRSPKRVQVRDDAPDQPQAHVFFGGSGQDSDPAATKPAIWSSYDIAEYLLAAFAPNEIRWRLKPDRVADPESPPPSPTAAEKLFLALHRYKPLRLEVQGRTVKDVLDELFRQDLGLSWRINISQETDEEDEPIEVVEVEVVSLVDADISFDSELVLPASVYSTDITIPADETVGNHVVAEAAHNKYGTIIVEGNRVLACFTLLVQGSSGVGADPLGELVPAWDEDEEAAYLAGASDTDETINDRARTADTFRHVFTTFRVRRDWDLNLASSGGSWGIGVGVNADGTLVTGPVSQFVRLWGNAFASFLPIPSAETQTEFDKEYLPPVVVMKDLTGAWHVVDRSPGPSASLRMLDRELGIEINANPNHLIAGDVSFGATPTATPPKFDYHSMKVTVALATDLRLSVTQTIPEFDPQRVLRVLVEDAESWWVQPGAVIDVNADGSLRTHAGGVVRSDHKRLGQIAAMIKGWFGRDRRTLTLESKWVNTSYRPGHVLSNMLEPESPAVYSTPLSTPVTTRRIDLERQTTVVTTDFIEPVFARMARRIT